MKGRIVYRSWYYFRTGWATYFAFILAAINTLTVTYYLAIENLPMLKEIFPSFLSYLLTAVVIGVPLLTMLGYYHFKKGTFKAEADIVTEQNPHFNRLLRNTEAFIPVYLEMIELLVKLSKNEKLSDDEIKRIETVKVRLKSYSDKKTLS
jgi:hypothetical protein